MPYAAFVGAPGGHWSPAQAAKIIEQIDRLVAAWCDRRCLRALRAVLSGWPLSGGLTDNWADLLDALEKVRAFARNELTEDEARAVEDLIHDVQRVVSMARSERVDELIRERWREPRPPGRARSSSARSRQAG